MHDIAIGQVLHNCKVSRFENAVVYFSLENYHAQNHIQHHNIIMHRTKHMNLKDILKIGLRMNVVVTDIIASRRGIVRIYVNFLDITN